MSYSFILRWIKRWRRIYGLLPNKNKFGKRRVLCQLIALVEAQKRIESEIGNYNPRSSIGNYTP